MKLVTLSHPSGERVAEQEGDLLYLLDTPSMLQLIESGGVARRTGETVALADVQLLAPIPRPRRNIMCIGKNYLDHAAEFSRSGFDHDDAHDQAPEYPIVFTKSPDAVIGPDAPITYPHGLSAMVDYEAEIAMVIGRKASKISQQEAISHIFGYTLINDMTARDLQSRHRQWFLGKSLDSFCPMGPAILTAADTRPDALDITCHVNGELRQSGNTADLIFSMAQLIEVISAIITLYPGDIIATGTPAGVGAGFSPPRFLSPGDEIRVASPQIGTLVNSIG